MPNCRLVHTIEKNILITVKNWWSLTYGQVYIYKKKNEKKERQVNAACIYRASHKPG